MESYINSQFFFHSTALFSKEILPETEEWGKRTRLNNTDYNVMRSE
jgi:hypothetical protein